MRYHIIFLCIGFFVCQISLAADTASVSSHKALITSRLDLIGTKVYLLSPVGIDDLATIDPACVERLRLAKLLFDQPTHTEAEGAVIIERLKRPENRIANIGSYHHYCWGQVAQNRYYRETDLQKRKDLALYAASGYKYVIDHTESIPKDWPYMHKMHVDYGKALLLSNNTAGAIQALNTALKINPKYIPAYNALADVLNEQGLKSKALEFVIEGLKYQPTSKSLKRRYTELGGKQPFPEPYPVAEDVPPNDLETEVQGDKKDAGKEDNLPQLPGTKTKADSVSSNKTGTIEKNEPPAGGAPETTPNKANPYCRFCAE